MAANNSSGSLEVLRSIEEFETKESKLKDNAYLQKKKNQIKEIGGKDASTAVRLVLDAIMSQEIQDSFSLYGLKNKQSFSKTLHYLCLSGALFNSSKEDYRKDWLDYHISDILKQAIRNKRIKSPKPVVTL
nr:uncharacterized protein LOC105844310 isoform X2 [Hydra vulgaris]